MNFIGIIAGLIIYFRTNSFFFAIAAFYIINFLVKQFSKKNNSGNNNNQRSRQDFQRQFQQQYQQQNSNYYQQRISKNDFATALLVLSASVMKADGNPLKSELDFVKTFFQKQFSPDFARQQMLAFRDILKKDFDIRQVCELIKQAQPPQQRSVLIQYLFGIAQADGHVSEAEVQAINRISRMLDISSYEFNQLKAMFYKSSSNAYQMMGIEKSATNDEVKKAYRKLAVKNHPDKFAQMGEEYQLAAKEKFQKIQDAYETIKKERGMN